MIIEYSLSSLILGTVIGVLVSSCFWLRFVNRVLVKCCDAMGRAMAYMKDVSDD